MYLYLLNDSTFMRRTHGTQMYYRRNIHTT